MSGAGTLFSKLENVAINNVLPLKAARLNASAANSKCFWGLGPQFQWLH